MRPTSQNHPTGEDHQRALQTCVLSGWPRWKSAISSFNPENSFATVVYSHVGKGKTRGHHSQVGGSRRFRAWSANLLFELCVVADNVLISRELTAGMNGRSTRLDMPGPQTLGPQTSAHLKCMPLAPDRKNKGWSQQTTHSWMQTLWFQHS